MDALAQDSTRRVGLAERLAHVTSALHGGGHGRPPGTAWQGKQLGGTVEVLGLIVFLSAHNEP